MPKESVYGDELPFGEDNPGVGIVEVRWDRGTGYFQIVTKCVHRADHSSVEACGIDATEGFYVGLGRKGINDLIRNLRRARDQAFGRDE